jgi:hypothetical protein
VDVAFDAARHDLALAVMAFGVFDQGRNQQRQLHHLAVHGSPLMAGWLLLRYELVDESSMRGR